MERWMDRQTDGWMDGEETDYQEVWDFWTDLLNLCFIPQAVWLRSSEMPLRSRWHIQSCILKKHSDQDELGKISLGTEGDLPGAQLENYNVESSWKEKKRKKSNVYWVSAALWVKDITLESHGKMRLRKEIGPRLLVCKESRVGPFCLSLQFMPHAHLTGGMAWNWASSALLPKDPSLCKHSLTSGFSCQVLATLALWGLHLHLLPVSCPLFPEEPGTDSEIWTSCSSDLSPTLLPVSCPLFPEESGTDSEIWIGCSSDVSPTLLHHPYYTQLTFAHALPSAWLPFFFWLAKAILSSKANFGVLSSRKPSLNPMARDSEGLLCAPTAPECSQDGTQMFIVLWSICIISVYPLVGCWESREYIWFISGSLALSTGRGPE